jgi:tetratricopeptide (TPR) repeat protein
MVVGAVDTAKALFEDAIAIHPRTSEAWMNLATINLDEGDKERAMDLTEKLLAINPRYFYARLMQAQIKATEGNLDAAVAEAEAVLDEQPHSAQAWLLRGQLAARQGDRATAIQAMQRTVAEHVEDPHLYLVPGPTPRGGRTDERSGGGLREVPGNVARPVPAAGADRGRIWPSCAHQRRSNIRANRACARPIFYYCFGATVVERGERVWNKSRARIAMWTSSPRS